MAYLTSYVVSLGLYYEQVSWITSRVPYWTRTIQKKEHAPVLVEEGNTLRWLAVRAYIVAVEHHQVVT